MGEEDGATEEGRDNDTSDCQAAELGPGALLQDRDRAQRVIASEDVREEDPGSSNKPVPSTDGEKRVIAHDRSTAEVSQQPAEELLDVQEGSLLKDSVPQEEKGEAAEPDDSIRRERGSRGRARKGLEASSTASPRSLELLKRKTQRRRHARTRWEHGDSVNEFSSDSHTGNVTEGDQESCSNHMQRIPSDHEDSTGPPNDDAAPRGITAHNSSHHRRPSRRVTSDEALEEPDVFSETDDVVRVQEVCRRLHARVRDYKAIADTALNQRGDVADLLREISRLKTQLDRTERRTAHFQKANETLQMRLDSLGEEKWCELEDKLSQREKEIAQQQKELKDLRRVQRQQEKALKGEARQDLAVQVQQLTEELRVLKEAFRDLKQTHRRDEEALKKKDKENVSLQDRCSRLADVLRGRDPADLKSSNDVSEKDQQIQVLTRRLEMLTRAKEADMRTHLRALRESALEISREKEKFAAVTEALVEKNKEVRLLNIRLHEYMRVERTLSPRLPRTSNAVTSEQSLPAMQPRFPRTAQEAPHTKRLRKRSEEMLRTEPPLSDDGGLDHLGATGPIIRSLAAVTRIYGSKPAVSKKSHEGSQWRAPAARGVVAEEEPTRIFSSSKPQRRKDLVRILPPISLHGTKEKEKDVLPSKTVGSAWPRNTGDVSGRQSVLDGHRESGSMSDESCIDQERKSLAEEDTEGKAPSGGKRSREASQESRDDRELRKRDAGDSVSIQESCDGGAAESEGAKRGSKTKATVDWMADDEAGWSSSLVEEASLRPAMIRTRSQGEGGLEKRVEKGGGEIARNEGGGRVSPQDMTGKDGVFKEASGEKELSVGILRRASGDGGESELMGTGPGGHHALDAGVGMVKTNEKDPEGKATRQLRKNRSCAASRTYKGGKAQQFNVVEKGKTRGLRDYGQENIAPRVRLLQGRAGRGFADRKVFD